jgi:hypothetical protein
MSLGREGSIEAVEQVLHLNRVLQSNGCPVIWNRYSLAFGCFLFGR